MGFFAAPRFRHFVPLVAVLAASTVSATRANAGSVGFGPEIEFLLMGTTEAQWSVHDGREWQTYAKMGQARFGPAPGFTITKIFNNNIVLAGSAFYRHYTGEIATPGIYYEKANIEYDEVGGLLRLGFMDFYDLYWTPSPFVGEAPTHPFGHFRLGVYYSDISGASDFAEYDPGVTIAPGIEFGTFFLPAGNFYVGLSGFVDYVISVDPYEGESPPGVQNKILNNIMFFGFAIHGGVVTEKPR
ncbi:MAG: hypothetical protein IT350_17900 [Deltaproteobacteria bacterium]|nr:hypothetical protein [Deltaproteobacteria bacterium]